MPKKGRGTPEDLDFAFERHLIEEDDYADFWSDWWDSTKSEQQDIIDELLEKVEPEEPLHGTITKSKAKAKREAKAIGGYVIRRNNKGRFSKRGSNYQAIRRRKK